MSTSKNFQFRQMEKMIQHIAGNYFTAKRELQKIGSLSSGEKENNPYFDYVRRVDFAYSQLNGLEKMVINNDFFYQDFPYWWEDRCSRASYYRYKKVSMTHFLEAFNHGL